MTTEWPVNALAGVLWRIVGAYLPPIVAQILTGDGLPLCASVQPSLNLLALVRDGDLEALQLLQSKPARTRPAGSEVQGDPGGRSYFTLRASEVFIADTVRLPCRFRPATFAGPRPHEALTAAECLRKGIRRPPSASTSRYSSLLLCAAIHHRVDVLRWLRDCKRDVSPEPAFALCATCPVEGMKGDAWPRHECPTTCAACQKRGYLSDGSDTPACTCTAGDWLAHEAARSGAGLEALQVMHGRAPGWDCRHDRTARTLLEQKYADPWPAIRWFLSIGGIVLASDIAHLRITLPADLHHYVKGRFGQRLRNATDPPPGSCVIC